MPLVLPPQVTPPLLLLHMQMITKLLRLPHPLPSNSNAAAASSSPSDSNSTAASSSPSDSYSDTTTAIHETSEAIFSDSMVYLSDGVDVAKGNNNSYRCTTPPLKRQRSDSFFICQSPMRKSYSHPHPMYIANVYIRMISELNIPSHHLRYWSISLVYDCGLITCH